MWRVVVHTKVYVWKGGWVRMGHSCAVETAFMLGAGSTQVSASVYSN
jgi:hypothetical protein